MIGLDKSKSGMTLRVPINCPDRYRNKPLVRPLVHQPKRYTNRAMTVCIAAKADVTKDPRIVLCCDSKLSLGFTSSDCGLKLMSLGNNWFCMMSGDLGLALRLATKYRNFLSANVVHESTVEEQLRIPLIEFGRSLIADSAAKYGVTLEHYMGGENLRQDIVSLIKADIEAHRATGAELIIAGFAKPSMEPIIAKVGDYGVSLFEDSACIGSGGYIAEVILNERDHAKYRDFNRVLYTVFEAKRFSERAEGVNKTTYIAVLTPYESVVDVLAEPIGNRSQA